MACQKFTPPVVCDGYHWRMHATVQALADLIKTAGSDPARRPLRVRGGGSKDFYGEPLQGTVLDTGALDQVVAYEPTELVITAGAGLRLRDLEALLATHNQCLPCDPPHFGPDATIGGAVAAALSGPCTRQRWCDERLCFGHQDAQCRWRVADLWWPGDEKRRGL